MPSLRSWVTPGSAPPAASVRSHRRKGVQVRPPARPEHSPIGDPCVVCRAPALSHRVEHKFQGSKKKCERCGLPLDNHRLTRKPDTRERVRVYQRRAVETLILGLDGEGKGRDCHRYVFLAAANEDGTRKFSVTNPDGLTTDECLWFLYGLPQRARLFGFSLGYDLTKILQCMTKTAEGRRALWYLMRPEKRQRFGPDAQKGPYPVLWRGWSLNLQGSKFTFGRTTFRGAKKSRGKKRILWDIFKFYQSRFVKALTDWKVGTAEERDLIQKMKEQRAWFDTLPPEKIEEYCYLECQKMAEQARTLMEAHDRAGLPLKTFYGAGSTAAVMLKKMGVRRHIAPPPDEMREAVARAFSGGRFELSTLGVIRGQVHGWDISSAYPYQLCQLPCLVHGHWEHVTKRSALEHARWALVRYGLPPSDVRHPGNQHSSWGPFPFRFPETYRGKKHKEQGSICYPISSGGGWVYLQEYLQGERLFPNVEFREAWIFRSECDCMPFLEIPNHYIERCRIGKEGPGIVLKLGCNSCYGKVAQGVGKGQFNSWVWAGMITSGCRAQGLELLGQHRDWSNLLMFATDGILSREKLRPPQPIDTGTAHVYECKKHKRTCAECPTTERTYKPLGGWEHKPSPRGIFLARPGVYFPLDPTEDDLETMRGRGVGRRTILDSWHTIVDAWENRKSGTWPTVALDNVSRFCGSKTTTNRVRRKNSKGEPEWEYRVASGNHLPHYAKVKGKRTLVQGKPCYGEWIDRKVEMSFDPRPKRIGRPDGTLELRTVPQDLESAPYDRAVLSQEAKDLIGLTEMLAEQPEADFFDYDAGGDWQ